MPSTSARLPSRTRARDRARRCAAAGRESSGSARLIDSSTAGWRSRKAAIASGISVEAADSNDAIRRRPPRRPAIASSSASASASRAMIASAWRTTRLAGVGEADAARAALHERRAGLALERGDLLRDGGLRERQRLGGGGERAAHGDLAEHTHAADVEHQPNLYHPLRTFICTDGPLTLPPCAEPSELAHVHRPGLEGLGTPSCGSSTTASSGRSDAISAIRVMVETVPPLLGAGVRFDGARPRARSWSACSSA